MIAVNNTKTKPFNILICSNLVKKSKLLHTYKYTKLGFFAYILIDVLYALHISDV